MNTSVFSVLLYLPYHFMALGFPLQLLVVVKCESVQNSVLVIVNCGHGALAVNLIDIYLLFPF